MLSYANKRRSILAAIGFFLLICMLAAPLRREYSTTYAPLSTGSTSQVAINKTTIRVGLPFTWLTLTKSGAQTGHPATSTQTRQVRNLLYDIGLGCLFVVIVGLVMRMDDVILPPAQRGHI
jgi:hypothetical protein